MSVEAYSALSEDIIKKLPKALSEKLNIKSFGTVTSTNALLKKEAASGAPEGTVFIASEQTAGRGRFTRSFFSPDESGIYISILLRPSLAADQAVLITTAAAVAVAEAAEFFSGQQADIKWVNDVLINGKKICGILTEAAFDSVSAGLEYAILGIGINLYEPKDGFPRELCDIAGAVLKKREADIKGRFTAELLKRFFEYYGRLSQKTFLPEYRRRFIAKKCEITVISGDSVRNATALDVDDNCRLHVIYSDLSEEYLSSGEISIKLQKDKARNLQ